MRTYTIYCFNGRKYEVLADNQEQATRLLHCAYGISPNSIKAIRKEV